MTLPPVSSPSRDALVAELVRYFVQEGFVVHGAVGVEGYDPPPTVRNDGFGSARPCRPDVVGLDSFPGASCSVWCGRTGDRWTASNRSRNTTCSWIIMPACGSRRRFSTCFFPHLSSKNSLRSLPTMSTGNTGTGSSRLGQRLRKHPLVAAFGKVQEKRMT